uniref:Proto-oncogene c-Fos n=1 Tax=Lygus hesperus TaxID=30085 RepID=A0A146L940_LYGHE
MYNMNTGLLAVPGGEGTGATPRTPEIVNSLMAMTDPFKHIRAGSGASGPRLANSPPSDSTSASGSPPSLQHTRMQLIKEGLKLTIQSKRKNTGEIASPVAVERSRTRTISEDVSQDSLDLSGDGLTPEDEERRRRRRERNKIAATKCRMKKRERTVNLVQESEVLESQNFELKSTIQELEKQKMSLVDLLNAHRPCVKLPFERCAPTPCPSAPSPYQGTFSRLKVETPNQYAYPTSSSTSASPYPTSTASSSYHHEVTCDVTYRSTSAEAMYHRQQEARYCRTSGASTSTSTYMYDEVVSDPNAMLPYCPKTEHDGYSGYAGVAADSPHTFVGSQDSPTSSVYTRPSSMTTSSSDYESNTELLDSPSVPPSNYHHFNKEGAAYPAGFPASSCCITC